MKTSDLLRKARKLIDKPSRWCKEVDAVDCNGVAVAIKSPEAARWCIAGAIFCVAPTVEDYKAAIAAIEADCGCRVEDFNDEELTTHNDVMELFDSTIKSMTKPLKHRKDERHVGKRQRKSA